MADRSAQEIYERLTKTEGIPKEDLAEYLDRWAFEAHNLPGGNKHQELLDRDPQTLYERVNIARNLSFSLLPQVAQATYSGRKGHTKGATAEAYVEILKNKDKYGLEGKTEEDILEAAWYSAEASDKISPQKIKGDLVAKKQAERRAELEKKIKDKNALEAQYLIDKAKIASQGPSEKELRDARRSATISYLEELQQDKVWARSTSNSLGALYEAENLAIGAAALVKDADLAGDAKAAFYGKLNELGQKNVVVGKLLQAGQYTEVFSNPSGYLASQAGKAILQRISQAAAAKATQTLVAMGLQALATTIAPIVGNIAAWVASNVLTKALKGSINRFREGLKKVGAAAAGLGLIIVSSIGSGIAVGAASAALSALILVPLIAFIMFVINASGYVVPPGPTFIGDDGQFTSDPGNGGKPVVNSYLSVTKTANPAGPFENSELPLSVEYTITITAKQQALTNIRFNYNCNAVGDAPVIYCPPISPVIPTPPARIEAGPSNAFVIKYTVNYPANFKNTIAMDTFVVTADATVGEIKNIKETGFASVQFGTVPTRCFKLDGYWPEHEKSMMIATIGQLLGYKGYVDKICSDGDILLQYILNVSEGHGLFNGQRYWGRTFTDPLRIEFYPVGFGSAASVFFTLAHESGHALTHTTIGGSILQSFIDTTTFPTDNNGYICTYPFTADATLRNIEDFAESAALYAIGSGLNASNRNYACLANEGLKDGTFKGAYPSFWNFMNTKVF